MGVQKLIYRICRLNDGDRVHELFHFFYFLGAGRGGGRLKMLLYHAISKHTLVKFFMLLIQSTSAKLQLQFLFAEFTI